MFEEVSPVLALPYIMPSQAQKHVTHNEAIRILDTVVQLAVISRTTTEPPETAVLGDRFLVPPGATGPWSGRVGMIAVHHGSGWHYYAANAGWMSWVEDEAITIIYDGSDWLDDSARNLVVQRLGVSATPDDINRLSVAAGASLFNHAGSGHQIKINKAAAIDTASMLFQTAFSGRAEMGLAGNNDFSLKVSADGTAWSEAIRVEAGTGRPTLPAGAVLPVGLPATPALSFSGAAGTGLYLASGNQIGLAVNGVQRAQLGATALVLDVPVAGTAVTQGQADLTAGRLLKVGDFGWGAIAPSVTTAAALDGLLTNQRVRVLSASVVSVNGPAGALGGVCDTYAFGSANAYQEYREITGNYRMWRRGWGGSSWSPWERVPNQIVGAITASGGTATHGGMIERGANANGEYARFADGTQICTHVLTGSASGTVTWIYPASFAVVPSFQATARTSSLPRMAIGAPGNTSAQFRVFTETGVGTATDASLLAVGRWF